MASVPAKLAMLTSLPARTSSFAVDHDPPEAVRVCLGGDNDRAEIERALEAMAEAFQQPQAREAAFF